MATGRQILLDVAAKKIALRNYEAWRFDQGDPMTNSRTYQICQDNDDFKYRPRYIHRKDGTMSFVELIEGVACDKQSGLPKEYLYPSVYKYYMGASEDTLERLGREIEKKARVLKREMIDQYDRQKIAQEYRAEKEQESEVTSDLIGKQRDQCCDRLAELEAQQPAPTQMYIYVSGHAMWTGDMNLETGSLNKYWEYARGVKIPYNGTTINDAIVEVYLEDHYRKNRNVRIDAVKIDQFFIRCEIENESRS